MGDAELHGHLMEFRQHFRRNGAQAAQLVPSALAAIREAAERKLGLRPFEVQLMGALALNQGNLAEMATGEGKTLTAGVAAVVSRLDPASLPCRDSQRLPGRARYRLDAPSLFFLRGSGRLCHCRLGTCGAAEGISGGCDLCHQQRVVRIFCEIACNWADGYPFQASHKRIGAPAAKASR